MAVGLKREERGEVEAMVSGSGPGHYTRTGATIRAPLTVTSVGALSSTWALSRVASRSRGFQDVTPPPAHAPEPTTPSGDSSRETCDLPAAARAPDDPVAVRADTIAGGAGAEAESKIGWLTLGC